MFSLEYAKPSIKKLLHAFSSSMNFEAAVFDSNFQLFISTEKYLKHKGETVHTPYLEEVFSHEKAIVSKPGHMPSCFGCRFKGHCPSTMELLSSIKIQNHPVGIISIVSFTKEGQERLSKNLDNYVQATEEFSSLMSSLILQDHTNNNCSASDNLLKSVMDLTADSILTVDNKGIVTHFSKASHKLFPACSTEIKSLYSMLPNSVINEILKGNYISNKPVNNPNFNSIISSIPLKIGSQLSGAVIKIEQDVQVKTGRYDTSELDFEIFSDNIKGISKPIQNIKKKIQKISNSPSTVLITGETGTGKELFAKAIHYSGSRAFSPFITINCASIPESLFESELFGYEEGAFTGAKKGGKLGHFELAHGGTLFLDEIGEMPMYMQAKLLRVLQEHTITRVGGTRSIPINVRVIAATNQNLEEMIQRKEFRLDLFYRLNVIPLNLVPLRDRQDDIEILSEHFLKKFNWILNKSFTGFSSDVVSIFKSYSWPGNIRELQNIIEYAANIEAEDMITINSLPENFFKNENVTTHKMKPKLKSIELEAIKFALDKYGWDVNGKVEAAKELGIGLRTLYRKIEAYGINKD